MMVVVGNNCANETNGYQCAQPVTAVHAAMVVMVMMILRMRRRCGVVMLYYNRAVVDGTAFMIHGLAFVHNRALVHRTAFVIHGLAFVHNRALVHRTAFVIHGLAFVHDRALMDRAAFVIHGLAFVHDRALVAGTVPMDGRTLVTGVPLHRAALLSGCALLHRWSCLLGTAFWYRPILLCLCRSLAAGLTGRRRFRNTHYERGTEKTGHQCDCQYFL